MVVLDAGAVVNIGWAAVDVETADDGSWRARKIDGLAHDRGTEGPVDRGTCLEPLVSCVADALERELPIALGVEAPCFVPIRRDATRLLDQRCGENGMAFSNQIGALAMVQGIVESAWLLSRLAPWGRSATVDPKRWPAKHSLLLWEAFVAREGKTGEDSRALPAGWFDDEDSAHVRDAATAAAAFVRKGPPSLLSSEIDTCGEPAFNTLAAAALRAGLSSDVTELSRRPYAVKAR